MLALKSRRLSIGLFIIILFLPLGAESQQYFSSIEDLPIAPGLTEVVAGGLSFQSSSGRIVVATARGTVETPIAKAFYEKSLPALGWVLDEPGIYLRHDEMLKIRFQKIANIITVYVHIVPAEN